MRPRDLAALEFDAVRNRVADFAVSTAGKEACRGLAPRTDRVAVETALDAVWQCVRLIDEQETVPPEEFPDIRAALRTASHEGFVLDGESLAAIRAVLTAADATRAFLRKHAGHLSALATLSQRLVALPTLLATLRRALDDSGAVTDEASDELADVRRILRHLREKLTRRLEDLLTHGSIAEFLADRYVTVRNNRFVVPIKTAVATQFSGIVQDRSVSGETTFIEPLFAVELNNRLLVASKDEEVLVHRILADLTNLVRTESASVSVTFTALVEMDALAARGRFARYYRCTRPQLDEDEILIRDGRHPILLFADRPITPIDLRMPHGKQILVITGPNTGGKTVALKTLGLLAVMTQSGLLIPAAEGSRLPCFQGIYTDVGDAQSIERNLSTFSAHVVNLTEILTRPAVSALVLLDEPGIGTDPDDGAALGIGLIRMLEASGARIVLSTHYTPIKLFALSNERCVAAAVDFDLDTMAPRYRLIYHSVGESLALPIARRLGLPPAVLDIAEAARPEQTRALAVALARLEDSRRDYEQRVAQLDERLRSTTEAQREVSELLDHLRDQRRLGWADELATARAFVRTVREQGRDLLSKIEAGSTARGALTRFVREQEDAIVAREAAEVARPALAGRPQLGDQVAVAETGLEGQLLSIRGERAWVQRGSMRFEVPAAQLRRGTAPPRATSVEVHIAPPEEAPRQITLLGLRAKDAISQLERFLDQATRANYPAVRIIHGVGSGALRRAVAAYLSDSPYCRGFRPGEPAEGGTGVTIAELSSE